MGAGWTISPFGGAMAEDPTCESKVCLSSKWYRAGAGGGY